MIIIWVYGRKTLRNSWSGNVARATRLRIYRGCLDGAGHLLGDLLFFYHGYYGLTRIYSTAPKDSAQLYWTRETTPSTSAEQRIARLSETATLYKGIRIQVSLNTSLSKSLVVQSSSYRTMEANPLLSESSPLTGNRIHISTYFRSFEVREGREIVCSSRQVSSSLYSKNSCLLRNSLVTPSLAVQGSRL